MFSDMGRQGFATRGHSLRTRTDGRAEIRLLNVDRGTESVFFIDIDDRLWIAVLINLFTWHFRIKR